MKNILKRTLSLLCAATILTVPFATKTVTASAAPALLINDGSVPATPSMHDVYVDDKKVDVAAYTINGYNYFRLRDIATVLSGSEKQFDVSYDNANKAISLISNHPYTPVGGELSPIPLMTVPAFPSTAKVMKDGVEVAYTGYNINGSNYYKLRDIGNSFRVRVNWDNELKRVDLRTPEPESIIKVVSNNPNYSYDARMVDQIEDSYWIEHFPTTEEMHRASELAMVDAINEERRNVGVQELVIDEDLMAFAHYWVNYMTTNFRHSEWTDVLKYAEQIGLDPDSFDTIEIFNGGENIAYVGCVSGEDSEEVGYGDGIGPVKGSMRNLMRSPGHKRAILEADHARIGIGIAVDTESNLVYICQEFGN